MARGAGYTVGVHGRGPAACSLVRSASRDVDRRRAPSASSSSTTRRSCAASSRASSTRTPGIEVVGTAPDPYVARDQIVAARARRDHARRRDAAHGRDHVPAQAHALPPDAGRHRLVAHARGRRARARGAARPAPSTCMAKPGAAYTRRRHGRRSSPRRSARPRACAARARAARRRPRVASALVARPGRPTRSSRSAPRPAARRRCSASWRRCPPTRPGIVIAQHMPEHFTARVRRAARRACARSRSRRRENGDTRAYRDARSSRPGNHHMVLRRRRRELLRRGARTGRSVKRPPALDRRAVQVRRALRRRATRSA